MNTGFEKRRHLRVPLDLEVDLKTSQGVLKGKTAEISISGLAVLLFLEKPETGNQFQIILKPSEGHDIPVTCERVWSGKIISNETVYSAIGIRFTKISSSDRKILASMVEEYYQD